MKICTKCCFSKPIEEFRRRSGRKTRQSFCISCEQQYFKDYRFKNYESLIQKDRLRYDSQKTRYRKLKQRYGVNRDIYSNLFASQNGLCAICKKPESKIVLGTVCSLSVDHNHKTGEVRGLLCANCNLAIGLLKDDPEVLENAIKYLRNFVLQSSASDDMGVR